MTNIIARVERRIIDDAENTRRLAPEYRRESVAYLTGYIRALADTSQINSDERDALYSTIQHQFRPATD